MHDPLQLALSRRLFLRNSSVSIGAAAFASLLGSGAHAAPTNRIAGGNEMLPHFAPKARTVIWLTQAGAPSQLELLDYKPGLKERSGQDLPASVRNNQRLTGMTSGQANFPVAPSIFDFRQ